MPSKLRVAVLLAAAAVGGTLAGCGEDTPKMRPGPFVASGPSSPATVWAVGDAADTGPRTAKVAELVRGGAPDRLLYLGDVYPDGTAEDFNKSYAPGWGSLGAVTAPTPGNHEWQNRVQGYDPYWRAAKQSPVRHRYSFELAGWQIISLNSEGSRGPSSEQVRWLRREVSRPGTCRLAFWHAPRYSAGEIHGDDQSVEPFWGELAGHAALVVNAHEHNMQRFKPRRGITQLVSGAGGHGGRYMSDERDRRLAFSNDEVDGALRLKLAAGRAEYAFVAVDGRTLDSGSVSCLGG